MHDPSLRGNPDLSQLGMVSVLVPAHNEAGNIGQVIESSLRSLESLGLAGEVVVVNDGSTDATGAEALAWAEQHECVRVFSHRVNLGLTAALRTGFRQVRGDVIVFLPGDMESDPEEDIPLLLGKMCEGYDVVSGWRQGRRGKKVPASRVANVVSRWLFGVRVHDMNWIKAFRRTVIDSLPPLRSDWHRFLLMLAASQGFRIGEVPTGYHPRTQGQSNYGFWRIPISFLDVLVVKFLLTFSKKPMLFFGGLGASGIGIGGLIYFYLAILYMVQGKQQRPFFYFAGVLVVAGLLLFLVGFMAELIVSQQERIEELERSVDYLVEASTTPDPIDHHS
jgi:glycosyltransferase involved in cell wall biosynthesis